MAVDLFAYDEAQGVRPLCGVDEAGRGPLAGDVYAAAVILPEDARIEGLNDSKKLSPKRREALYEAITGTALSFCVASASVEEIERLNILNASLLAMRRAVDGLSLKPGLILIDGNRNLKLPVHSRCIVGGDGTSACIAAASVLAKVERDRYMRRLDEEYPQYQFGRHKGYGTALHYQMLDKYGPSPVHRPSFLKDYTPGRENLRVKKGRIGEERICALLTERGYQIRARNYRCKYGEIDLIAQKDGVLAFVEVKARTAGSMGKGREAVSAAKEKRLMQSALCYIQEAGLSLQPRFDVAEVVFAKTAASGREIVVTDVAYYENAFDGSRWHVYC